MKNTLLFTATILILVALTIGITFSVSAEDVTQSGTWGSLTWTLNETTGELVISGEGSMSSFSYTSAWQAYKEKIKAVTIEEGVTSIGYYAFEDCSKLTSITIPDGVTSIGYYAFHGCSSLTSITIPDSVTSIGDYAFSSCSSLKDVYITNIEAWLNISFGGNSAHPNYYGTLHILDTNGNEITELVIPDSVTSIGSYAFYNCSSLTSITIPDSVTSIGDYAFRGCSSLTSITIPDSVTSIGCAAFINCTSLTSIVIPASLTSVGGNAFHGCSSLTSITIPDSVTSIGERAFYDCSSLDNVYVTDVEAWLNISFEGTYSSPTYYGNLHILDAEGNEITELVIPDSVTSIGDYAFSGCSSLTSITIPDSVTSIGDYAFRGCYKLVEVINHSTLELTAGDSSYGYIAYYALEVHNGESKLDDIDGFVFYTYNNINYLVDYLGEPIDLVLPANYNGQNYEIYKYAFYYKNDITAIIVSETVRKIHPKAFGEMKNLQKVTFNAIYCADMTASPFGSSKGFVVEIGAKVAKIPACLFYNCNITSVTFAENCICSEIGDYAFYGCNDLISVVIPNYVTTIGTSAFYNCYNLTHVTVGSAVTTINSDAFRNCYKMTEVINHSSMNLRCSSSNYGYVAYYALEVHTGGSKLERIGDFLFYPYNNRGYLVNYVGVGGDISLPTDYNGQIYYIICDYAFYYNDTITSVVIPKYIDHIGRYSFSNCSNLKSVVIGDGLAAIGYYAFQNCDKLITVKIGEYGSYNVGLQIDSGAFYDCDALVSIVLPKSTKYIQSSAFYSCSALESIVIGSDATSIGSEAFRYCSNLKSITIGKNITSIGSNAFTDCTNLKIVYLDSTTISAGLTSSAAYGNLIQNAEVVLVDKSIENVATFLTVVFSEMEELTYEGVTYTSYSLHAHIWESCDVEMVKCERDGFTGFKCASCGLLKGSTTPAHDYSKTDKDTDYHWDICADCGDKINILLHGWNSGEVTTPATHLATGVKTFTCSECGATKTEDVAKLTDHTYGDWTKKDDAQHQKECACGDIQTANHAWGSWKTTVYATHLTPGERTLTCNGCGATKTEEIPRLTSHEYGNWVKKDELQHHKICACGAVQTVANHNWNNGEITTPATHLATGVKTYTCFDCGATKTEDVAKLTEHTYGDWTKKDDAQHQKECACGDIQIADHTYSEWITTTAPTEEKTGEREKTCVCGHKVTESIPVLEHEYESVLTNPTCTEQGYTTHTCINCGDVYKDSYVDALGHTYDNDQDASCNTCGETREIATEPATETNDKKPSGPDDKKSGCGATISSGVGLMMLLIGTAMIVPFKKKKQ